MSSIIELTNDNVQFAIRNSFESPCPYTKQKMMEVLESFQGREGLINILIDVINNSTFENSRFPSDCRLLATVILKNTAMKGWNSIENKSSYIVSDVEKSHLKSFLSTYFGEKQLKVANQLSNLTAKLAKIELPPKNWNNLIQSIVSEIVGMCNKSSLRKCRALCCLIEIIQELSVSPQACVKEFFNEMSLDLFPKIAIVWAQYNKCLQSSISKIAVDCESEEIGHESLSSQKLELNLVLVILTSKVLTMINECMMDHLAANFRHYNCFCKTYAGFLQFLCNFLRKCEYRTMQIVSQGLCQSMESRGTPDCVGQLWQREYAGIELDLFGDDEEESSDPILGSFYFPLDRLSTGVGSIGFLKIVNLIRKEVSILVRVIPLLQKNHEKTMTTYLSKFCPVMFEELCSEFKQTLISDNPYDDRFTTATNNMETYHTSMVTFHTEYWHYCDGRYCDRCPARSSPEMPRFSSSLSHVTHAAVLFLSNMLSCTSYNDYNVLRQFDAATSSCTDDSMLQKSHPLPVVESFVAANVYRKEFFSEDRTLLLLRLLLFPLLMYSPDDMVLWVEDNEQFSLAQQGASESTSLRAAAESLFCGLIDIQPEVVTNHIMWSLQTNTRSQWLVQYLHLAQESIHLNSIPNFFTILDVELMRWEALLLCCGLGTTELLSKVDANDVLRTTIVPLYSALIGLKKTNTGDDIRPYASSRMLLLRILWLLQTWIASFEDDSLCIVINVLCQTLTKKDDKEYGVSVKLQACETLLTLMEHIDPETVYSFLLPQLEGLVGGLCALVAEHLQESDHMVSVLNLVSEVVQVATKYFEDRLLIECQRNQSLLDADERPEWTVEQLRHQQQSLYLAVTHNVTMIWNHSSPSVPVRATLLEVLKTIIDASKWFASQHISLIIGVLMEAMTGTASPPPPRSFSNPISSSCSGSCLWSEGIALWTSVIRNTPRVKFQMKEVQNHLRPNQWHWMGGGNVEINSFSFQLNALFHQGLRPLFPNLPDGNPSIPSDIGTSHQIMEMIQLVEAYCVVGQDDFLRLTENQAIIYKIFDGIFGKIDGKFISRVVRSMELILLVNPQFGSELLLQSGLLNTMLKAVCTTAPCPVLSSIMSGFESFNEQAIVSFISVIARLMLCSPGVLLQSISNVRNEIVSLLSQAGITETNLSDCILLSELVEVMLNKAEKLRYYYDRASWMYRSRLWCVALLTIFPAADASNTVLTSHIHSNVIHAMADARQHLLHTSSVNGHQEPDDNDLLSMIEPFGCSYNEATDSPEEDALPYSFREKQVALAVLNTCSLSNRLSSWAQFARSDRFSDWLQRLSSELVHSVGVEESKPDSYAVAWRFSKSFCSLVKSTTIEDADVSDDAEQSVEELEANDEGFDGVVKSRWMALINSEKCRCGSGFTCFNFKRKNLWIQHLLERGSHGEGDSNRCCLPSNYIGWEPIEVALEYLLHQSDMAINICIKCVLINKQFAIQS